MEINPNLNFLFLNLKNINLSRPQGDYIIVGAIHEFPIALTISLSPVRLSWEILEPLKQEMVEKHSCIKFGKVL